MDLPLNVYRRKNGDQQRSHGKVSSQRQVLHLRPDDQTVPRLFAVRTRKLPGALNVSPIVPTRLVTRYCFASRTSKWKHCLPAPWDQNSLRMLSCSSAVSSANRAHSS
jgi:hypothetical protein